MPFLREAYQQEAMVHTRAVLQSLTAAARDE